MDGYTSINGPANNKVFVEERCMFRFFWAFLGHVHFFFFNFIITLEVGFKPAFFFIQRNDQVLIGLIDLSTHVQLIKFVFRMSCFKYNCGILLSKIGNT